MCESEHITAQAGWRQFVMDLGILDPAGVEAIFVRHGAQSIALSDAGDDPQLEPAPGETPLWRESRISGLFGAGTDFDALRRDLLATLGLATLPTCEIEELPERQWEREWLRFIAPTAFGRRLWICPGDTPAPSIPAVVLRLDPGMAFGTGSHATTALCLEWLDGLALEGRSVLDYGCGSGVLAIAALLLGARAATAMDIDPQAVTATRDNARRNGVSDALRVAAGDAEIAGSFDVVVANILADPLIELAASITARVRRGCLLALSGILSKQVDDVLDAYSPQIEFEEPVFREQDGQTWARLAGRRIEG